jgi:hypothetical protein
LAVGGAVVAAAVGLVEHQLPVLRLQLGDQRQGDLGGDDSFDHGWTP